MEGQQEDVEYLATWSWMRMMGSPMTIRAAIELNVFNIIASSGVDSHLSAAEIVSHIPTTNPDAATVLDRILRNLAANSFLSSSLRENPNGDKTLKVRVYGLTKESRCLVSDKTDLSLTPAFLFSTEREVVNSMYMLKDAVLDPEFLTSGKNQGVSFFDQLSKNPELSRLFNEVMSNSSKIFFHEVLKVYGGFEGLEELMDVGGGIGTSLGKIVSKYPRIHGINFDMPHVIAEAPKYPGVDHVAGDMFDSLPKAKTIILKWILHDWDDEKCKKLLRNCWEALPENGKVIVLEFAIPEKLENEFTTWNVIATDFIMLTLNPGGKERTVAEFEDLAKASGFVETKVCVTTKGIHVMELLKRSS